MKKILILLVILVLPKLKAEEWTSILPNEENIKIIETEERYKWYKEKIINERYMKDVENNCEYFDLSDYIYSEESEWSKELPEKYENRIIETKENKVLLNNEFNKILLNNFDTVSMFLKEIYVLNGVTNKFIEYKIISCNNCETIENLNDKNPDTYVKINGESNIILELDKSINPENMIVMLMFDKNDKIKSWKTTYLLNEYKLKWVISYTEELTRMYFGGSASYKIPLKYVWNTNHEYKETLYRYKDKMYKCFDYEKEYLDDYYAYVDEYIKDEDTSKIFYKIEELKKENIIIENKEKNKEEAKINTEEIIGAINDEEEYERIAINYGNKLEEKNYELIPVYIVTLGMILILLVFICRKLRLNLENNR